MSQYTTLPQEELAPPYAAQNASFDEARTPGDNVPDDFKFLVNVAECELPLRQLFVRKVYALLLLQIFGTVLVGFLIRLNPAFLEWSMNNIWLFFVSLAGSVGFLIAASVYARSYPKNLLFLAGFTLCEAYGIGLACALIESEVVVQALLLTFIIFIGLTLFAFQTKYDFVSWQGIASMGLWALFAWGFVLMFFPHHSSTMELVYSGVGALLFSVYVLIDTQKIMKTTHLDDEVRATITLYLDVVNLFFFILRILNNRNE